MNAVSKIALSGLMIALLGGCAVKPLKAPCAREEGGAQPMAYSPAAQRPPAIAAFDQCGPMKPVNADEF